MIVIVDDATTQVLYAELRDGGESVAAVMTALRVVLEHHGLPMALYTDRAHWAAHTPTAGGAVDRRHPTQVGRALARLGIEHILGYSPQARGRSERANRTLQGRLVNEFRLAGITTVAAANRYLRARFLPSFNAEFARPPADPASAFVPLAGADLDQILCVEEERVVGRDNVVTTARVPLQVAKQPGRRTCAGLRVLVRRPSQRPAFRLAWHALPGALRPRRAPSARRVSLPPLTERPFHGVKQLRSDHVSATRAGRRLDPADADSAGFGRRGVRGRGATHAPILVADSPGQRASGKWQATRWPSPRSRRGGSLAGSVHTAGRPA